MDQTTCVQPNQSIPQILSKNHFESITVKNSPACSDNGKITINKIELKTKFKNITEQNTLASLSNENICHDKDVKEDANNKTSSELSKNPQRKNAAYYFSDTLKTDVEEQKNVSNKTQLTENCQENCLNETQLLHFGEDLQIDTDEDLVKEDNGSVILADDLKKEKNHDDSDLDSDVIYLPDVSTKTQDPPLPDIPTDSDLLIIMDEDSFQSFIEQENSKHTAQAKAEQFVSDKKEKQIISSQSDGGKNNLNSNPEYLQVNNVDTNKNYVQSMLQTSSPSKFSEVEIIMDEDSSFSSLNDGNKPILMEFVEDKALDTPDQIIFSHIKEELSVVPNDEKQQKNLETEIERDLREIIQSRREKNLEFENESDLREIITQSQIQKNVAFENKPDLREVLTQLKREKNPEFENESDLRKVLTQSQRKKILEFENDPDLRELITQSRNERNKLHMLPDLQLLTENQDMKLIKEESDQILEDNESFTSNMDIKTEIDEENICLTGELTPIEFTTEQDIKPTNIETYVTQLEFEDKIDHLNSLSDGTEDNNKNIEPKNTLSNNLSQSEPKSCENNKTDVTVNENQSIDINNLTINTSLQALSQIESSLVKPKRTRRRGRRNRNKQIDNNSNIQSVHNDSTKGRKELNKEDINKLSSINKEIVKSHSHTVSSDKNNERASNNRSCIDKHKFTRYLQYDKYEIFGVPKSSMTAVQNHNSKPIIKLNNNQKTKDKVLNNDAISVKNKSTNDEKRIYSDINNVRNIDSMLKQPNNVENVNKSNASRKEIVEKSHTPSFRISKRKDPLPPENPNKRVKLVRPENTTNSVPRDHIHETRDYIHETRDHIQETGDHIQETGDHIHETREHTPETRDHTQKTNYHIWDPRYQTPPVAKVAPRPRSPVRPLTYRQRSWEQMWADMRLLQTRLVQAEDWKHQCDEELAKWDKELERCTQQLARIRARRNLASDACAVTSANNSRCEYKQFSPRHKNRGVISVPAEEWTRQSEEKELDRCNQELTEIRTRRDLASDAFAVACANNSRREYKQFDPIHKNRGVISVPAEEMARQSDKKELDRCNQELTKIRVRRDLASDAFAVSSANNSRCEYEDFDPRHKNRGVISVPAEEWKRHSNEKELTSCNQELTEIRVRRDLVSDAFAVSSANNSRCEYEDFDPRQKNRGVISVPAEEWKRYSNEKELTSCDQELTEIRVHRNLASDAFAVSSDSNSRSEYEQFDPRHKHRDIISVVVIPVEEWKRQSEEQELDRCNQESARIRARRDLASDAFAVSSAKNSRCEYEDFDPRHKNRDVISVPAEEWTRQSEEKGLDRCNQELTEIRVRRDLASDAFAVSSANNSRCEYEDLDPRHKHRDVISVPAEEGKRQSNEKELTSCNQKLAQIRVRRDLVPDTCDQQDPTPCLVRRRRRRTRTRKRKNHETIVPGELSDPRLARDAAEERDKRSTLTQERQGQTEQANQELLEHNRQSFRDLKITTNGRQRMIDPYTEEKHINTNKSSSQSILHIEKRGIKSLLDIDPWTL